MSDDPFETVAIAYSQPQAAVILSLFEWNGIPAYAANLETVRASTPLTLALGGIPIRVLREAAAEAREILTESVERTPEEEESEAPAETLSDRVAMVGFVGVLGMMAVAPPPRLPVEIVG